MNHIPLALPVPYVGLRPFEEKDAVLFFGRDAQVRDLLAKLENKQRFISVLGASGSGKSSLVRSGLLPALHQAELAPAGYRWKAHIIKPGNAPLHQLVKKLTEDPRWIDNDDRATSMASLHSELSINPLGLTELYRQRANLFGDEALLLVVDQFEEIFRYRQQNIDETEAFIKLLLCSASEDVPIYVVMTLRSDFLDNCATFVNLPEAINSGLYLMPRLRPDQLQSIIVSPLALVGGNIDPILVNRLVNTPGGENELPVLEHALLRMWNHAQADGRRNIEEQDFPAICKPQCAENDESAPKLEFAIDNHASEIFGHLTWRQKHVAHQLFLSLIDHREIRDVHRPQTFAQLIELIGEQERGNLLAVINAFREEGADFLHPPIKENILDGELIAISNDNLLRQWHPLQQWLTEETRNVTELMEWQQRTSQQSNKENWLDECDCERALRWLDRISEYVDQQRWAARQTDPENFSRIKTYIATSKKHLEEARIERERQRKEKLGAETKRLEATVRLHSELAENAENKKLQAEALAQASRRNSYFAIATAIAAILFALISIGSENGTNQVKNRAEEMAPSAQTRKIPPLQKIFPKAHLIRAYCFS